MLTARRYLLSHKALSTSAKYEALLTRLFALGLVWRLDSDPASHAATDLTLNSRNGIIGGGPVTASPGLVSGVNALTLDGVDDRIEIAAPGTGLWMDTQNFTMGVVISFTDFAIEREVMGRPQTYQVWIEVSGALTVYASPPWTSFGSVATLTAGVKHLVMVRKDSSGGKISLWIDGVKDSEMAHGDVDTTGFPLACGYSSTGPRYTKSIDSYFAWAPVALSDQDMLLCAQQIGLHA